MAEHKLVDGALKRDEQGITARCECGWVSAGHFSSLAASAAMQEHREQEHAKINMPNRQFYGVRGYSSKAQEKP